MKMLDSEGLDTAPGQAVYRPWVLYAYDLYVLKLSCSLAWRCPASELLEQYNRLISGKHLDVGVGTGYFLDRCRFPVERSTCASSAASPCSKREHRSSDLAREWHAAGRAQLTQRSARWSSAVPSSRNQRPWAMMTRSGRQPSRVRFADSIVSR